MIQLRFQRERTQHFSLDLRCQTSLINSGTLIEMGYSNVAGDINVLAGASVLTNSFINHAALIWYTRLSNIFLMYVGSSLSRTTTCSPVSETMVVFSKLYWFTQYNMVFTHRRTKLVVACKHRHIVFVPFHIKDV